MFDDEMLTIEDLAAYLKLKPQTIYKWAQSGKVPGAKFGKEWRFRRSTIEAWIDSHMNARSPDSGADDSPSERTARGSRRKDRVSSGNGTLDPSGRALPTRAPERGSGDDCAAGERVTGEREGEGEERQGDERESGGRSKRRGVTRRGSRSRGEERGVLNERGPGRN